MSITSAIVLLAIIWWLTFLVVLPFKVKTQGDLGEVETGTHAGAPQVHHLPRKALITTGLALVIWAIISSVIISGALPVTEIEFFQLEKRIYDGKDG